LLKLSAVLIIHCVSVNYHASFVNTFASRCAERCARLRETLAEGGEKRLRAGIPGSKFLESGGEKNAIIAGKSSFGLFGVPTQIAFL
jgi:hypothetical protein